MEPNTNVKDEDKGYEIIICPHCDKEVTHIENTEMICPYCGHPLNQDNTDNISFVSKFKSLLTSPKLIRIISIILLLYSIVLTVMFIQQNNGYKRIDTQLNNLSGQYSSLYDHYSMQEDRYEGLYDNYQEVKSELDDYKDQQATIDDLNAKLTELQGQYDSLQSERDNLQAQVDAKKAEQERIAQEQAAQQLQQQQANAGGGTVYWVAGGSVYHSTPNCPTLKRSSNIQSGSVSQSGKSRACKVCN